MSQELPWSVEQNETQLTLCHDHRWLRVIGFPLMAIGTIGACGLWFLPGVKLNDALPMLAVGTLIGIAFVFFGMQLSFSVVTFSTEIGRKEIVRREGFGPFTRTQRYTMSEDSVVRLIHQAEPGRLNGYILEIRSGKNRIRIAKSLDQEPIEFEGIRWASFLKLPLESEL